MAVALTKSCGAEILKLYRNGTAAVKVWVALRILQIGGAMLVFFVVVTKFCRRDERVRNGIVSFRRMWKTTLVDYDGHVNLKLFLEAQFVLFPSLLRFGTRLASQSGGEDDAEDGRSWIGTLRLHVLVMKLENYNGELRERTKEAAVKTSTKFDWCCAKF
jgi:hypothetical protein